MISKTSWRIAVVGTTLQAVAAQAQQSFHTLNAFPGAAPNSAVETWGLSGNGQVVLGGAAVGNITNAYAWTGGTFTNLGLLPGGTYSQADGASFDGSVVVGWGNSSGGARAWRRAAGATVNLGVLPGAVGNAISQALAVSSDGLTVSGVAGSPSGHEAYRWHNGLMMGLGDFSGGAYYSEGHSVSADGSVIVGYGTVVADRRQAFRWSGGIMQGLGYLPGGDDSVAEDVTPDGSTIVGFSMSSIGIQGFVWRNGVMTGLGRMGSSATVASAVSANGEVIVGRTANGGSNTGIIWDATNGWRPLSTVLQGLGLDLQGMTLNEALAISDDGLTIAGRGHDASGVTRGWVATLPSPSTCLAMAAMGVFTSRRRR